MKFIMKICFLAVYNKDVTALIRAATVLGYFISLISCSIIIGSANALTLHLPLWLISVLIIGVFILSDKLADYCFEHIVFNKSTVNIFLRFILAFALYILILALTAILVLSILFNVFKI